MPAPHRITLEIDSDQAPIRGQLHASGKLTRPFTGWISLLAALEQAIGPDQRSDGEAQATKETS